MSGVQNEEPASARAVAQRGEGTLSYVCAAIVAICAVMVTCVLFDRIYLGTPHVRRMSSVMATTPITGGILGAVYGVLYRLLPLRRTLLRSVLFSILFGLLVVACAHITTASTVISYLLAFAVIGVLVHVLTWLFKMSASHWGTDRASPC